MNYERSPYWYPRLDRWLLAVAAVLLVAVAVLGLRGRQQPRVVAPTITAPAAGVVLTQGSLGEISGTAAPNAVISLFDGGNLLGATTADAQGNWRFTLPELAEGSHNLAANILSPDGKLLASTELGNITVQPAVIAEATTTAAPAAVETPAVTPPPAETAAPAPAEASPAPTAAPTSELAIGQPEPLLGKAPVGTTVAVREGNVVLGQTIADADGKWQIDLPPMAVGEHELSVSMTDDKGNLLVEPQTIKIKVEAGAPITPAPEAQPTAPAPSAGPVVGNLSNGATLVAEQPGVISGTAAPGAVVTISEGDAMWGQTKAGIDGQWSIDLPALIPGEHVLAITAVDASGKAVGQPVSLTVNAVASAQIAEPIINAPASAPTAEQPTLIEGVAPPNATITLGEGETVLGTTIADKTGKWQIELPGLPAGEHKLVAAATDASGAPIGESQEITITVAPAVAEVPAATTPGVTPETTPAATAEASPVATTSPTIEASPTAPAPAITNLSPGATLVAEQPGLLSGTAPPGATVVIKEGEKVLAEAVADAEGKWQIELPALTPGQHELSVNAQDASGLLLGALAALVLNAVSTQEVRGPVINAPAAPLPADQPATLSGIAPPGATISISEGSAKLGKTTADASGNWQIELPALTPGEHTLVASAANAKGKPLGRPTLVVITVAPPATPTPEATAAATTEATTEATAVAPGATTEATAEATPAATTEVTAEATPAATAEATTEATPAATTTPQPLPTAPALLTTLPTELTNSRPTLSGVAVPGSTITIFDGDQPIGKTQADAQGNWYFVPKKSLAPGEHPLRLEVTAPGAAEPVVIPLSVTIAAEAKPIAAPSIQTPKRGRLGVGNLLRGQAPPNAKLQIKDGDQPLGEAAASRRGGWQFRLPTTLAAGPHTFRVVMIGPDGEVLAESAPVIIEIINLGPPTTLPVTGGKHVR